MGNDTQKIDFQSIEHKAMSEIKDVGRRYGLDPQLDSFAPAIARGIAKAIKEYDRQKGK